MNPVKGLIFGIVFFLSMNSYILFLNERHASLDVITCYEEDAKYSVSYSLFAY